MHAGKNRRKPDAELLKRFLVRFVVEDAFGSAVEILILAAFHRPEEGAEAQCAERQSDRDEVDQDVQATTSLPS